LSNKASRQSNGFAYIVFLAAVAAVPPLATDMYLPAMPTIAKQWDVPDSRVALSLVLWFVGFSIFLLVCGLEQVRHDIGSASSFIAFYQFVVGAVCMRFVSLSWEAPIRVFGLVALLLLTVVLAVWPLLLRMLRTPPSAEIPLSAANAV